MVMRPALEIPNEMARRAPARAANDDLVFEVFDFFDRRIGEQKYGQLFIAQPSTRVDLVSRKCCSEARPTTNDICASPLSNLR